MKLFLVLGLMLVLLLGCTGAAKQSSKTEVKKETSVPLGDSDLNVKDGMDEPQLDDLSVPEAPTLSEESGVQESDILVEESADDATLDDFNLPSILPE